MEHSAPD
jgi:methylglutaconyl-CoA hydratase